MLAPGFIAINGTARGLPVHVAFLLETARAASSSTT